MVQKIISLVRNYPMTTVLVAAIWVVCIVPIPENPLSHVSMMDKWTHIVMYFVLTIVIAYEQQKQRKKLLTAYSILLPPLMGGVLELVQEYCTGGTRSGDWIDFAADVLGCALATVICILLARCRARGGTDNDASDGCRNGCRQ